MRLERGDKTFHCSEPSTFKFDMRVSWAPDEVRLHQGLFVQALAGTLGVDSSKIRLSVPERSARQPTQVTRTSITIYTPEPEVAVLTNLVGMPSFVRILTLRLNEATSSPVVVSGVELLSGIVDPVEPKKCNIITNSAACRGVCPDDPASYCRWNMWTSSCQCGSQWSCRQISERESCGGRCPEDALGQCRWDEHWEMCSCTNSRIPGDWIPVAGDYPQPPYSPPTGDDDGPHPTEPWPSEPWPTQQLYPLPSMDDLLPIPNMDDLQDTLQDFRGPLTHERVSRAFPVVMAALVLMSSFWMASRHLHQLCEMEIIHIGVIET